MRMEAFHKDTSQANPPPPPTSPSPPALKIPRKEVIVFGCLAIALAASDRKDKKPSKTTPSEREEA